MTINFNNIIDAYVENFEEQTNVMVVLFSPDAGTSETIIDEKGHMLVQAKGHPVEVLPKTHKLYNDVVKKFNITI